MLVRFGRTACGLTEGVCKRALEEVADGIAKGAQVGHETSG